MVTDLPRDSDASGRAVQVLGRAVGPDASGRADRVYLVCGQILGPFLLLVVDPVTGASESHQSPLDTETGAGGIAVDFDGKVYIGSAPNAHLFQFDPKDPGLIDLGQPCPGETCIWCLATAPDGTVYGGTSPHAKLFACTSGTGEAVDLGRVYGRPCDFRHIAVDPDGFVYCGIGPKEARLIRYTPATGHRADLLPRVYRTAGTVRPVIGRDGIVYAILKDEIFEIEGNACIPLFPEDFPGEPSPALRDGREISEIAGDMLTFRDPNTGHTTSLTLGAKWLS